MLSQSDSWKNTHADLEFNHYGAEATLGLAGGYSNSENHFKRNIYMF
jgi:hypothetical protein